MCVNISDQKLDQFNTLHRPWCRSKKIKPHQHFKNLDTLRSRRRDLGLLGVHAAKATAPPSYPAQTPLEDRISVRLILPQKQAR